MGAELLIPAALAVGGAVIGGAGAKSQNAAIGRSMRSQAEAAGIQQNQLAQRAGLERRKRIAEARQIEGRIRVLAAADGVGVGGSWLALLRQADADAATNLQTLDTNYANQIAAVRSGAQANLDALSARVQNELLAAFAGGARGYQTGLSINSARRSLAELEPQGLDQTQPLAFGERGIR